jgi:hypothetical protein
MFGPLNGVRVALVAGALVAAVVAAGYGRWEVTLVLGLAIIAHGLLWLRMWRDHQRSSRTGG